MKGRRSVHNSHADDSLSNGVEQSALVESRRSTRLNMSPFSMTSSNPLNSPNKHSLLECNMGETSSKAKTNSKSDSKKTRNSLILENGKTNPTDLSDDTPVELIVTHSSPSSGPIMLERSLSIVQSPNTPSSSLLSESHSLLKSVNNKTSLRSRSTDTNTQSKNTKTNKTSSIDMASEGNTPCLDKTKKNTSNMDIATLQTTPIIKSSSEKKHSKKIQTSATDKLADKKSEEKIHSVLEKLPDPNQAKSDLTSKNSSKRKSSSKVESTELSPKSGFGIKSPLGSPSLSRSTGKQTTLDHFLKSPLPKGEPVTTLIDSEAPTLSLSLRKRKSSQFDNRSNASCETSSSLMTSSSQEKITNNDKNNDSFKTNQPSLSLKKTKQSLMTSSHESGNNSALDKSSLNANNAPVQTALRQSLPKRKYPDYDIIISCNAENMGASSRRLRRSSTQLNKDETCHTSSPQKNSSERNEKMPTLEKMDVTSPVNCSEENNTDYVTAVVNKVPVTSEKRTSKACISSESVDKNTGTAVKNASSVSTSSSSESISKEENCIDGLRRSSQSPNKKRGRPSKKLSDEVHDDHKETAINHSTDKKEAEEKHSSDHIESAVINDSSTNGQSSTSVSPQSKLTMRIHNRASVELIENGTVVSPTREEHTNHISPSRSKASHENMEVSASPIPPSTPKVKLRNRKSALQIELSPSKSNTTSTPISAPSSSPQFLPATPSSPYQKEGGNDDTVYQLGSMFWAKIGPHPWWPCWIYYSPDNKTYHRNPQNRKASSYHVQFFGPQVERSWVSGAHILPFTGKADFDKLAEDSITNAKNRKEAEQRFLVPLKRQEFWNASWKEAEVALALSVEERINKFGRFYLPSGKFVPVHEEMPLDQATDMDTSISVASLSEDCYENSSTPAGKKRGRPSKSLPSTPVTTSKTKSKEDDNKVKERDEPSKGKLKRRRDSSTSSGKTEAMGSIGPATATTGEEAVPKKKIKLQSKTNEPTLLQPITYEFQRLRYTVKTTNRRQLVCYICEQADPVDDQTGTTETNPTSTPASEPTPGASEPTPCATGPTPSASGPIPSASGPISSASGPISSATGPIPSASRATSTPGGNASKKNEVPLLSNKGPIVECSAKCRKAFHISCLQASSSDSLPSAPLLESSVSEVSSPGETLIPDNGPTDKTPALDIVPNRETVGPDNGPYIETDTSNTYKCSDCSDKINRCFVCGQDAYSSLVSSTVMRCSIAFCRRYYHEDCIFSPALSPFVRFQNDVLICPCHTCHSCTLYHPNWVQPGKRYIRCVRCPRTYHLGDVCVPVGSVEISNSFIICPSHFITTEKKTKVKQQPTQPKSLPPISMETNNNTTDANSDVPISESSDGSTLLTASDATIPPQGPNKGGSVAYASIGGVINVTWCFICSKGGHIICCETCPASFHPTCLDLDEVPESFICENCETGRFPRWGEFLWAKVGRYRWWPAEAVHPRNTPDWVFKKLKQKRGQFLVHFFGTDEWQYMNLGRVFTFEEGDDGERSPGKSRPTTAIEGEAMKSKSLEKAYNLSLKIAGLGVKLREKKLEKAVCHSNRPEPFKMIKTNYPIGSVRFSQRGSLDHSALPQCDCKPIADELTKDPCGLHSNCMNRELMYECHPSVCRFGDLCHNQDFTLRNYPKQAVFKTEKRGWGLRADVDIVEGQFVNEYVGDLIDEEEANRRLQMAHDNNITNFYMMKLDSWRTIDAGPRGNLSRFMNHSCGPNLIAQRWTVAHDTRVGLFALRNIKAGEELTFNYNFISTGQEKLSCQCLAPNCSGFIGDPPKPTDASASTTSLSSKKLTGKATKPPAAFNNSGPVKKLSKSASSQSIANFLTSSPAIPPPTKVTKDTPNEDPASSTVHAIVTEKVIPNNDDTTPGIEAHLDEPKEVTPIKKVVTETMSSISVTSKKESTLESRRSSSSKSSRKSEAPAVVHEEECYRCGETGELVLCDKSDCTKAYHIVCLGISKPPHGKWFCPWHHCETCGRPSVKLCSECPASFCKTHAQDNIYTTPEGKVICFAHDDLLTALAISHFSTTETTGQS